MVQGKQQFKGQQKKDVYKRKVQKTAAKTKKGFSFFVVVVVRNLKAGQCE